MKHNDGRERLLDAAFLEVYKNGYHGAATASILKNAGVPKGSMYHFFNSKKGLILAVIKERIFPKMDAFFDFTSYPDENIFQSLERIFKKMSTHEVLIANGCPMHRLLVEMAPLDKEFETVLAKGFESFVSKLSALLTTAIDDKELEPFNTEATARFFITSIWGEISLPPSLSSKESFLLHADYLVILLKQYKK